MNTIPDHVWDQNKSIHKSDQLTVSIRTNNRTQFLNFFSSNHLCLETVEPHPFDRFDYQVYQLVLESKLLNKVCIKTHIPEE